MTQNRQNTQIQGEATLLPQWGLIFVEGPDSASFLQNQLTNSVLGLKKIPPFEIAQSHDSVRLVGYCSPKGRLLASAWVVLAAQNDSSEDRFALFVSKDIAAATAKRLAMFVLRSKVKVTDVSDRWSISGVYSPVREILNILSNDEQIALRLPDVLLNNQSYGRILIAQKHIQTQLNPAALTIWNDLEVMSAIPRIVLATQEQFVPQMINFESVAGVDFKKGCYPGQEIVARSQYRGVIKRRLFLAHTVGNLTSYDLIQPGTELFHSEEPIQPAGMVVLSSPSINNPSQIDLQVECKLEALENGEIHLASGQGPVLKIDSLPYSLIEI